MIEIFSSTPLCTVQDFGRLEARKYGVGSAGAMDQLALSVANIMLNNPENSACIEVPVYPFSVKFHQNCDFSITGPEGEFDLDNQVFPTWWAYSAKAGQILTIHRPVNGGRAYLALGGGIDVPIVMGSRSTQLRGEFGGFEGRMLARGDQLSAAKPVGQRRLNFGVVAPQNALQLGEGNVTTVRTIRASEYMGFPPKEQEKFWNSCWKVTPQSNRYGYRLEGEPIKPTQPIETLSHGIVPGVIQIPPNGQPIIQLRDAQPTGGYPKFGTVIEADLWRLGQAAIGGKIRFRDVTYEQACQASEENSAYLKEVKRMVNLVEGF